jgi:thymidylate synthase
MRSADLALGVPFNIASYSFITHIIAYIVGLTPGELSISMCDCHIYENHLEGIETQLQRTPRRFPTIKFSEKIKSIPREQLTIDNFVNDFTIDDYIIEGYDPHPFIKLPMAV